MVAEVLCMILHFCSVPNHHSGPYQNEVAQSSVTKCMSQAKRIFVTGAENRFATEEFLAQMRQWGRYEIVTNWKEADLLVSLTLEPDSSRSRTYPTYNAHNAIVSSYTTGPFSSRLALTVSDHSSVVWKSLDRNRSGGRSLEGELRGSADRAVQEWRARLEADKPL